MVAAYDTLGVSVTDSNGNLHDSDTVYWELIVALGNVENEIYRLSVSLWSSRQNGYKLILMCPKGMFL